MATGRSSAPLSNEAVQKTERLTLHPAFPFIRDLAVQKAQVFPPVLHRCQPDDKAGDDQAAKDRLFVIFLLFEEDGGPVRQEEIADGESESAESACD